MIYILFLHGIHINLLPLLTHHLIFLSPQLANRLLANIVFLEPPPPDDRPYLITCKVRLNLPVLFKRHDGWKLLPNVVLPLPGGRARDLGVH